jgi:hypothetical protein
MIRSVTADQETRQEKCLGLVTSRQRLMLGLKNSGARVGPDEIESARRVGKGARKMIGIVDRSSTARAVPTRSSGYGGHGAQERAFAHPTVLFERNAL